MEGAGRVHQPLRVHRDEVGRAAGGEAHLGGVDGAGVQYLAVRKSKGAEPRSRDGKANSTVFTLN